MGISVTFPSTRRLRSGESRFVRVLPPSNHHSTHVKLGVSLPHLTVDAQVGVRAVIYVPCQHAAAEIEFELAADRKIHRAMVRPRGRMGTAPAVASDGALEALDQGAPRQRCAKRVPPAPPRGVTLYSSQLSFTQSTLNGPYKWPWTALQQVEDVKV